MAFSQPGFAAIVLTFESSAIRYATWCNLGLSNRSLQLLSAFALVPAAAIALTFVTDAVRNRTLSEPVQLAWVLGLLCASPVVVPMYWLVILRHR